MAVKIKQAIESFHQMRKKRFFQVSILIAAVFLVLSAALPWWQLYPDLAQQIAVPLHYNIHFGVDLFGQPWRIFIFPISGAVILALNMLMAFIFWRRDHVLSYFFVITAAIASIVIFIAMIFVTLLNLSYA